MSMKNSNNTIGNRTRDVSVCSPVPQPTAPPRAPSYTYVPSENKGLKQRGKYLYHLTHFKFFFAFSLSILFVCFVRFSQEVEIALLNSIQRLFFFTEKQRAFYKVGIKIFNTTGINVMY
jgi:hypothetical protein